MTTFPFMEDYSSEDYEDDYCYIDPEDDYIVPEYDYRYVVPEDDYSYFDSEEPLTLRSTDGTPNSIERKEVAPDSDPQMPNAVEASIATLTPPPPLKAIESTREATVPIHQRHEGISLEMFLSEGYSNPACLLQECRTMLKNWIQRFLSDLARLRIRFYRALGAVFRRPFAWATRKHE